MNSKKEQYMTEREQKMFGISIEDIKTQYMQSLTAELTGMEMVVMGVLSDAQEMMSMNSSSIPSPNSNEYVRKQLNIAKFILSEMMEDKLLQANSRKVHAV
jgi:hypothetical protein